MMKTNEQLEQQAESLRETEELLKSQQEELQQTNEELQEKAELLARQKAEVEAKNRESIPLAQRDAVEEHRVITAVEVRAFEGDRVRAVRQIKAGRREHGVA